MMAIEKRAVTASHWSEAQYRRALIEEENRLVLALEQTSGMQGFLVARFIGKEWEIENLAVAGPARRRGLGSRLVGALLDRARSRGAGSVFLEVRESNQAARSLYEKWGFVESGRRKAYYQQPVEDALIYRLDFS